MEFADEIPLPAVGIDLGTTYSRVAVWKQGRVEIVPNDHGSRTTPSCVAFTPTGRLIGDAAKYQADVDPSNSIFDVKRLIGRSFDDEALLNDKKFWPFKIIGKEKKPKIVVTYKGEERPFAPEEITAMILCKMVEFAEDYLGTIVRDVVVTVPACFNNIQRQATKDAGTIAGVNVMHIINEPTAAAIAHCLHRESKGRKNVLVFDLGGGTFDASLIVTVEKTLQVKSVSGNAHLGGRDFDNRMIKMLVTEFQRKQGKNIRENSRAIEMLRAACERAKRTLSSEMSVDIEIDHLLEGIDFSSTITRAQFEKMNMDLFEECINLTDKCLKDAEMDRNDINEIVLVGGSSRIPMVQQLLQAFFCGKELCNSINPDEAVAYGAATQAAVLRGTYYPRNLLVKDISTYSLWVNSDTYTSAVIPRHTPIPGTLSAIPYEQLNPNLLAFQVFEGERPKVGDNVSLGVFTLHGIPPEDVLKRNFCFDIDADGILKCSSNDLETGYKNEIPVEHPSGHWQLSREEVCKLIMATEIFKREDEWQRQSAKARISLENYLQTISGMVKYHGNKIQHEDRKELTDAILQCQKFIQSYGLFAKARRYQEKLDDLKKVCDPFFTFSNGDGAD